MKQDINLSLRTSILEIALNVEKHVNLIILTALNIKMEKRKAISNKSGNLSFKNKIDLLFDLEIFNKEEHTQFLLLMEFRNQFLHNIECNSFTKAITILGHDKEKLLLKFDKLEIKTDIENRLYMAFKSLYIKSIKITVEKINKIKELTLENTDLVIDLLQERIYLTEFIQALYEKILDKYEINFTDSKEIMKLKFEMFEFMTKEITSFMESEEYKNLNDKINISLTENKIQTVFK